MGQLRVMGSYVKPQSPATALHRPCPACNGTGARPSLMRLFGSGRTAQEGYLLIRCATCRGSGRADHRTAPDPPERNE
jgi:DnaJ-class molecular chaperone